MIKAVDTAGADPVAGVTAAVDQATVQLRELLDRFERDRRALEADRLAMEGQVVPRDEGVGFMQAWVQAQQVRVRKEHGPFLLRMFGAPPPLDAKTETSRRADALSRTVLDLRLSLADLAGFFPEMVASSLEAILTDAYAIHGRVGLPAADRPGRHAEVLRRIADLEKAEEDLIRRARSQNIPLPRRPEAQQQLENKIRDVRRLVEAAQSKVEASRSQLSHYRGGPDLRKTLVERLASEEEALRPLAEELADLEKFR